MWSEISCGVREVTVGGRTPEQIIRDLFRDEYDDAGDIYFSQVIFSDNLTEDGIKKRRVYGEEFADYIRKNNLGTVIATRAIKNRNSGNKIKTWVWNVSNLRKTMNAVGWKKPKDEDYGYGW